MKRIVVALLLVLIFMLLTGCNRAAIDLTYNFQSAAIKLPNGDVVRGKVQNWLDYENSDMLQVKIDGKTYLTHSANVVLIAE